MMRIAIGVLALVGCGPGVPMAGPAPPPPGWRAGDLHVHATGGSNDTDDQSTPQAIADVAHERGLDFVVLTDHSNATGSLDCPGGDVEDCPNLGPEFPHAERAKALTDGGFVMVVGNEISPIDQLGGTGKPTGHIGCLPPASGRFEFDGAFVDRPPGEVTSGDAQRQCAQAGGLSILNHPFALAPWVRADWTTTEPDGVEVWNGGSGWDVWDEQSLRAWECLVLKALDADRKPPVPIASSDVHRVHTAADSESPTDPPLGRPRTSVYTESLVWSEIHQVLAEGGPVVLHEDDTWLDRTGGRTPQAGRVEVRSFLLTEYRCDPALSGAAEPHYHEVIATQDVPAGEFALTVDLPDDPYYLVLTRDDLPQIQAGDVAFAGPFGL